MATEVSVDKIHSCALDAEKELEKLATYLAQAGVDNQIVDTVGGMADAMRQIAKSVGKPSKQGEAPVEQEAPQKRETMDTATNSLVDDVRARREQ